MSGNSPDNVSDRASGPGSRRSSLASVDGNHHQQQEQPTTAEAAAAAPASGSRKPKPLSTEDIVTAASAATGVDLVAEHQRNQQRTANRPQQQQQQSTSGRRNQNRSSGNTGGARRAGAASASARRSVSARNNNTRTAGVSVVDADDIIDDSHFSPDAEAPPAAEPQLPGLAKRAARKQSVGMRLSASRMAAGVNQHDVASRCGVAVNKIFAIEKGTDDDLEKWCKVLSQVAVCLGVPFTEIFGDYLACTQNPHIVAGSAASLLSGCSSTSLDASVASSSSNGANIPPWRLTVGGRIKHAREKLKVSSEMLYATLCDDDENAVLTRDEFDDLEMCQSTAEDIIPVLLYILYRTGIPLATIVL